MFYGNLPNLIRLCPREFEMFIEYTFYNSQTNRDETYLKIDIKNTCCS